MTHVSVELCGRDRKFIINNLYPLYLHDLAGIRDVMPNKYGVFEEEDEYRTLEQQIPAFDIWWEKEGVLFPYLITVDGYPAGFALIATPPYSADDSEFMVHEFFILRPFRGKGIGERAAKAVFDRFRGRWMLFTTPTAKNERTIRFWRKTLAGYTGNRFSEADEELDHFGFNKTFRFTNRSG